MLLEPRFSNRSLTRNLFFLGFIAILILVSHATVWRGQFGGEDEVMQLDYAMRMISDIRYLHVKDFFRAMAFQSHPPLRYFLSIPGLLLFPNTEFGLRLGAILFSILMTYQVMMLGKELGGDSVAVASGVLVALSPVYNWTSIAFGWSVIVVALICSIRLLRTTLDLRTREGKRVFVFVNLLVMIAFLINTGCILFFASTLLVFFLANIFPLTNLQDFWRNLWTLIKLSIPFVLFYAFYYIFYLLIVPYVVAIYFGATEAVGQYHHNLARAADMYLNYSSFIENLGGINAYFFPYISWFFFGAAIYYLIRYEWPIALWLSLFTLAWSFLLTNQSHQYFLLVFIAIVPYSVKFFHNMVGQRPFVISTALLALFMALWNYQVYLRPYGSNDPAYPATLVTLGNAYVSRVSNITEPYAKIGEDIDALLDVHKTFVHDLGGSFTMYYYKTRHYAGQFGSTMYPYEYDPAGDCYQQGKGFEQVQIVVTMKEICSSDVEKRITYPNSKIRLFVLKP